VGVDDPSRPRIGVLADDLIWASRLTAAIERAGATPVSLARQAAPADIRGALVDLGGRAYDGVERVASLAAADIPVVAVGQHEDLALRQRALSAGARRVYSYNHVFRHGAQVVAALLDARRAAPTSR
jgi:DNA-binding NarL/FixJ family response regulator